MLCNVIAKNRRLLLKKLLPINKTMASGFELGKNILILDADDNDLSNCYSSAMSFDSSTNILTIKPDFKNPLKTVLGDRDSIDVSVIVKAGLKDTGDYELATDFTKIVRLNRFNEAIKPEFKTVRIAKTENDVKNESGNHMLQTALYKIGDDELVWGTIEPVWVDYFNDYRDVEVPFWSDADLKKNHVRDEVWIYYSLSDAGSGIAKIRVKEKYLGWGKYDLWI